jgi:hypothetical protein
MSPRALDIADLGFQVGDHVCAFYNEGGNALDDIFVDYVSKGLQAGNKCVSFSFADTASSVRDRIPGELVQRKDILQFVTDAEALLDEGGFSKDALISKMEAMVKEALSNGYERFWVICDVAFVVRNALPIKDWFAFEAVVNEFAPRYPQFLMCLYNLRPLQR